MLGWNIGVYRQADGGGAAATAESALGTRVAIWQTHDYGLRWLDELVTAGKAIDLDGDGYPNRYTAVAEVILPKIIKSPPDARDPWAYDVHDILGPGWEGKTTIDQGAAALCRPDEWLLIEAWDES